MKIANIAGILSIGLLATVIATSAQENHSDMKGMKMPMQHSTKMVPQAKLKPAQGASVKILLPKAGQTLKGDSVPLEYQMKKGKVGEHVHAYIDGEMAGMFNSTKGTLNGVKPGQHTLELRVVTSDHNTELDATDKVTFITK
jgi:hypothetical protein